MSHGAERNGEQRKKKCPGKIVHCSTALGFGIVTRSGAERRTEKEEMSREDSALFYCTWFRHCHTQRSGTENRERRNVQGR